MNKPVDVIEDWNVISISLKDSELELITRISRAYQISVSDALRVLIHDSKYISFNTVERAIAQLNIVCNDDRAAAGAFQWVGKEDKNIIEDIL